MATAFFAGAFTGKEYMVANADLTLKIGLSMDAVLLSAAARACVLAIRLACSWLRPCFLTFGFNSARFSAHDSNFYVSHSCNHEGSFGLL
ncbi:unnamed protein product [Polarella glacialis]|uniref:Uncharacterized protein n=1 Tax=Polarella glacialis TaxID=89957 RepID=A0A813L0D7_POLGL|nr:unnamed protein product [Polarella glacialis]